MDVYNSALGSAQLAILPILIPLAAAAVTAGVTAYANNRARKRQEKQNIIDREWQEKMYMQQRADAEKDFNTQNAYNSPEQQMVRLRQAGLNPNLVYGKGAENTAQSIRSSNVPTGNQPVPGYQSPALGAGLDSFYKVQNMQAQTDNLQQGTAVGRANEAKLNIETAGTAIKNAQNEFDLKQANRLKDITVESAILDNQKKTVDIGFTLDENQRQEVANSSNVALTTQKIISEKLDQQLQRQRQWLNTADYDIKKQQIENMKQQLINAQKDGTLKDLTIKLQQDGIYPGDPTWIRMLMQHFKWNEDMDPYPEQLSKEIH